MYYHKAMKEDNTNKFRKSIINEENSHIERKN